MLRPTARSVKALDGYLLEVEFNNGEVKIFDVKPYIQGDWYGNLKNIEYFNSVHIDGLSIAWEDGQDICPDELYYNSKPLTKV